MDVLDDVSGRGRWPSPKIVLMKPSSLFLLSMMAILAAVGLASRQSIAFTPIHHQRRLRHRTHGVDVLRALEELTVPELKDKLRSAGERVSGKKSELIDRLELLEAAKSGDEVGDQCDPALQILPKPIQDLLVKYVSSPKGDDVGSVKPNTTPRLLQVQEKSFPIISNGNDAVIFSPTGTGKSLAFILPLAARLLGWKHDGTLEYRSQAQKRRYRRIRNVDSPSAPKEPATPSILIVEPSRELARQVGKVWSKFHPTSTKVSSKHVVTVYGGVPVARHASLLSSTKTDVVVGTPGRIKELIREKNLSTERLKSIVLDEADTLLDFKDSPEVQWLLQGMKEDYQLVLASATVNKRVEDFVGDVMELEVGEEGYIVVDGDELMLHDRAIEGTGHKQQKKISAVPVQHWSMAVSAYARVTVLSDIVVTLAPRRGIVFASSKAEVESVAQELSERFSNSDVSVLVLHGDMVQSARTRAVNGFRGGDVESKRVTRLLIASDVAARGLDLPAVDLVVQFGVPRESGKDGTFDSELYIHRTGRAGRFGNTRQANVITFFDRGQGEAKTVQRLTEEMKKLKNIDILPRQLPSPSDVLVASFERSQWLCEDFSSQLHTEGDESGRKKLVEFYLKRLQEDLSINSDAMTATEETLLNQLAISMASTSNVGLEDLNGRSLLTADKRDRTIRIRRDGRDADKPLSPSEVTKLIKGLRSGKLGRIMIIADGSAVFDCGSRRAKLIISAANADPNFAADGWHIDIPESIQVS